MSSFAKTKIPTAVRGRPRNYECEAKVVGLLASGMRVGKIAAQLGIHRNTVSLIRLRVQFESNSSAAQEVLQNKAESDALKVQQLELLKKQREADRRVMLAKYKLEIEHLVSYIEKAASVVEKCRSVWMGISLDKPLSASSNGTMHDLIGGVSASPAKMLEEKELSELLGAAMQKLSEFQQRVIGLSVLDGQNDDEIASSLGIDESEVANARATGLSTMRNEMADVA